ncbi:hypothetical protein [Ekhidna sp.]|uniref:hypothetical protein n=1 Tax=Ekhidna sp. TaxID=2608089 RepID=UPI0035162530
MKKLILFSLIGLLITPFISCNSDEGDDNDVEITLEGTLWVYSSRVATGCDNPQDDENVSDIPCTENDCETITLNNGILTIVEKEDGNTEIITATYIITGNTVSVSFEEEGTAYEFDIVYSIKADILTIMFTFPLDGCDVVETYVAQD